MELRDAVLPCAVHEGVDQMFGKMVATVGRSHIERAQPAGIFREIKDWLGLELRAGNNRIAVERNQHQRQGVGARGTQCTLEAVEFMLEREAVGAAHSS